MAATELDIIRDEQERSNLLRTIASVESAMADSTPGTRRVLENTVENAKKRITTLDKRIEEAKVEHAAEVQAQTLSAAALAAKETKLSAKERETYRSFLDESYFTKKDLGRLDQFYKHSYDRLSEGGKEEMSERLHEGIRRGEIKVTDLSKAILVRDNEHCAAKAKKDASTPPHSDKNNDSNCPPKAAGRISVEDINLGSIDMSGAKLAEAAGTPSTSSLPDVSSVTATQR